MCTYIPRVFKCPKNACAADLFCVICVHMHAYIYTHIYIYIYTYIYKYFDICTHAHTHIYICIHIHFHYVHMYTCSWQQAIFGLTRESPLGNGLGVAVPPVLHLVLWEVREVPKQDAWTYVAHGGQQSGVLTRKPCVFVCFSTKMRLILDDLGL